MSTQSAQVTGWHELTPDVRIRVGVDGTGRPICTGLHIDAPEGLTSRELRRYMSPRLLAAQVAAAGPRQLPPLQDRASNPVGRRRGRPAISREELAQFMETYRRAVLEYPQHPVEAVARLHNMSRSTAHRWINSARAQGLT